MSRIGKKTISIPDGVSVELNKIEITAKGQLGQLTLGLPRKVKVVMNDNIITVDRVSNDKEARAMHGTYRQLIFNLVIGVSKGFEKVLELIGVGYRMIIEDKQIVLNIGFSHQVKVNIPDDLNVKIEKNKMTIFGIDKQKVGQFAAEIRSLKKPEPYKGKGIRYFGEKIKLKAGKTAKAAK